MDAGKLVELGSRIVKISSELSTARAARDEAQSKVLALETELMPLLAEHAQLISGLVGTVTTAIAAPMQPVQPVPGGGPALPGIGTPGLPAAGAPVTTTANSQLKARVFDYLKRLNAEEPVSATDVADVLKIDSFIVREAMMELRNGRR